MQDYFGNEHYQKHAPGMKTLEDALELRACIIGAFELAESVADPDEAARLLTLSSSGPGPHVSRWRIRSVSWLVARCPGTTATSILAARG
jgi:hypothetical protein